MCENASFDMEALAQELADQLDLEGAMEDALDDALSSTLPDIVREALEECLADYQFTLPDGTQVAPRQKMRLLSPDKTKQLLCYGGLRVSDTSRWNHLPNGWALEIQTRPCSWEILHIYPAKEEAVAALEKVSAAMEAGETFLAL
ncbi:MAG: hypothetical protein J6K72_01515 [Clostridia bacterium]|nr:hypothetical protein [Clostridia bacterium]